MKSITVSSALFRPEYGRTHQLAVYRRGRSLLSTVGWLVVVAAAVGPIPMMIGAELFRQGPRPRAMSLAGLTNWLFTAVVALSFELVQVTLRYIQVGSVAEWLACWTRAQKGPGSNRSRDAVG